MSKIKSSRNRKTCSVFGCMNSNLQNPGMAFFSLPSDPQRLATWLSLMDRKDLSNKPERHYRVCETHFDRGCILVTSNRKVLKKNAMPSLHMPVTARLEKAVQTPRVLLPVVFRLKPGAARDAADLLKTDEASEESSLYCEEGTEARGRGALLDAAGKTVGRVHEGFQCNLCSADIFGFRYTCVQCADYDLCAACEARRAHAHHYVLRVPGPRPYTETQGVLSRIRRQLLAAGPDNAALSDSLKFDQADHPEIKLEADDPLDPGPDPLQHLESSEHQEKYDTSHQLNRPLETFDTNRKEDHSKTQKTCKQARLQTDTGNGENTAAIQNLIAHELNNESQKRQYMEQNDDDLPLKRLCTDQNISEKIQFELPTDVPPEGQNHYMELTNDEKRHYLQQHIDSTSGKTRYMDRLTDHVPEKRQYPQEKHLETATLAEETSTEKTEDRGSFGVLVYTHSGARNLEGTASGQKSISKMAAMAQKNVSKKVPSKKVSSTGTSESRKRNTSRKNIY